MMFEVQLLGPENGHQKGGRMPEARLLSSGPSIYHVFGLLMLLG